MPITVEDAALKAGILALEALSFQKTRKRIDKALRGFENRRFSSF
jgi:hypothetical protein